MRSQPANYWEIIVDDLTKAGWSWRLRCSAGFQRADNRRDDGKRFIVRADERLTAFLELRSAIRAWGESFLRASRNFDAAAE